MKKKTIKINFKYFYEGFNQEKNIFTDILRKKYNVVISEYPDYMFYSVYQNVGKIRDISGKGDLIRKISPKLYILARKIYSKLNNPKRELIAPEGDFIKILYSAENKKPDMEKCDWALSSYFEEEINHPNYFRLPPTIMCNYPIEVKLPLKRKINFNKIKKEKTEFCNFIYSQDINNRNSFFKELSKYKKIDAPGRCMNNMSQISNSSPRSSRVSKDWVETKLNFLKPYKFTIAFENKIKNGWTTEKLTHPLFMNSVPIYVGNKQIGRDFNTKCFINYNDFKNMEEFIKHIISVDKDDELYRQYLEQPIFNNTKQHYFNSNERIAEILYSIIENEKKIYK